MEELLVPSVMDIFKGDDMDDVSMSMTEAGLLTPIPRGAVDSSLDRVPVRVMLS